MRPPFPNFDTLAKWIVKVVIATILLLSFCIALYFADWGYRILREKRVRLVYDAQKIVVNDSVNAFVEALSSEGSRVSNKSHGNSGSGDWRNTVIIETENDSGELIRCHVEVQGFVSHNAADQPIWTRNLSMTIKSGHEELDARYIDILTQLLEKHRWEYTLK